MLASACSRRTTAFRILCVFLIVLLIFSFVAGPKAQALGVTAGMVAAAVAAFLASCGLNLAVTGMNESGVSDNIAKLLEQYVGTVADGLTVIDWIGSAISRSGGALMLTQPGALKLAQFANWLVGEYGVEAGSSVPVLSDVSVTDNSGNSYSVTSFPSDYEYIGKYTYSFILGDVVYSVGDPDITYSFGDDFITFTTVPFMKIGVQNYDDSLRGAFSSYPSQYTMATFAVCFIGDAQYLCAAVYDPEEGICSSNFASSILLSEIADTTLGITADDTITVPTYEGVTEDQGILLDVGGSADMTDDALIDKVLSDVISGELSSTQTLTDTANPPAPDPSGDFSLPVVLADVFPFCIPFDIYDFLATMQATREAPRFEFELAFPAEIGGTQTIVLDLSDFEPVAEILRTMELILFIVGLAFVTRQLIRG